MGIISDKIKQNQYNDSILRAIKLQNESAFYIERNTGNPYENDFDIRIKEIYNKDQYKFNRFKRAFKGETLPSIDICETIFNELFRIFDSHNKFKDYNFKNNQLKIDAQEYLSRFDSFYKVNLWNAIKTRFNSFVVIDLPEIQNTERPEPYPYILNISNVRYLKVKGHEPDEIIFEEIKNEDKKYYWYNSQSYSVYDDKENLIFETPHLLGYCPVKFIKNTFLNSKNIILRSNNITSSLEDLFWYVFKKIESCKADLLYLNPDKQMPQNSCGWEGKNEKCYGGKLVDKNKQPVLLSDGITQKLCPNCGEKQYNSGGAGNSITIDYNADVITEGKIDPTRSVVQYIAPPIDGVNTQYERIEKLKEYIIKSCIGEESVKTRDAINKLQQMASFESKEIILKNLAIDLSYTIQWIEKTKCKLRYGNMFIKNSYSLGDKWYLQTVEELLDRKDKTTNPVEKEELEMQILEIKYKNNPNMQAKGKLLYKLMPYRTLSDKEFIELVKQGKINKEDEILRFDFSNLIDMFELEYGDMIEFYDNFSDSITGIKRLTIIKDILKQYYNEKIINQKIEENV